MVRTPVVMVLPYPLVTFFLLSFYPTVIMATPFDNSDDSFVDFDDFDLEDEGADVREPDDDDADLTLPLSDTPLETIEEEDEEDDGPELGPELKKGWRGTGILTIGQRIQGPPFQGY